MIKNLHLRHRWRPRNGLYKRMGLASVVLAGMVLGYELGADEAAEPVSGSAFAATRPAPGAGMDGSRVARVLASTTNTKKVGADCTCEGEATVRTVKRRVNPLPEKPASNCRPQEAQTTGGDAAAI